MDAHPKDELRRFLAEDIGCGDATSALLPEKIIGARIIAKEGALVAGVRYAGQVFALGGCRTKIALGDGRRAKKNQKIMDIRGTPQGIFSCERTALNLLSRMSGIATQTDELVRKARGVPVYATRKTAPGLRFFDKEAVRIGGGCRHRMSLDEMIMLKDNHLAVGGSIASLLACAKKTGKKIEIEVERQSDAVLAARMGADVIMLDNFTPERISRTVLALKKLGLYATLEASGRIGPHNISRFAKTGIDRISAGSITSSVRGIDFSLEAGR